MLTLGIELSTDTGGIALVEDGRIRAAAEWEGDRFGRQRFFADIHKLSEDGVIDFDALDLIAVGVGPGSFSGLRMAVSAACALASPDHKTVFAVPSAEALAWATFREGNGTRISRICVAGDARRNEIWIGRFSFPNGLPERTGDWAVVPVDAIGRESGDPETVWVTSDWDCIGARLSELRLSGQRVIPGRRVPAAAAVADLAARKHAAGLVSGALAPIYVRPAVLLPAAARP